MKFLRLFFANLKRKRMRTILTVASFAVALFLFGLLVTISAAFSQGIDVAGADRLVVRNRISLIMPLPVSYKEQLLQIPGVNAVTYATWFGGVYQDERNFFPQFSIETETWRDMYPEYNVPDDHWESFLKDRQGCIAGRKLMERFGWKIGDRIPLRATIFGGTWEFNLCGVYDGNRREDDTTQFWFHGKYLEERRSWGKGEVGWYTVKVDDPDRAAEVSKAIDGRFENSPNETTTETEKAFAAGFVNQFGNIKLIMLSVGAVVFFTLLLITGSNMAMSVRERTPEIAVLKTIGFSDTLILAQVLIESLAYAMTGGLLGLLMCKLFTLNGDPTGGMLPLFYLSGRNMLLGVGLTVLVGVAAGIIPAMLAMRLRIVDAMRRV
ncbi:FtsX-like permease family protein [bacterium]|nr:FtsX-like permease family protein [candidate division CSSED10-310 bacterium]